MRLFFMVWSGKDVGLIDVVRELKKNHEIVYWDGPNLNTEVDKTEFPNTIFHDTFDALAGKPAPGVDTSDLLPIGEDLASEFYETESTVLTMMHKKFSWSPIEERKHFYHHYLQYWYGVIKKFRPDAIIYSAIPHTVYDYVVYSIARKLSIKTIMFEPILRSSDRVLTINDYKIGSVDLINALRRNASTKFSVSDLKPHTGEHYEHRMVSGKDALPLYLKQDVFKYSGINLLRIKLRSFWTTLTVLKEPSIFLKIIAYTLRRFGPNLKTEYLSVESRPDFREEYIYVALQYQPEAQACPQGGIYSDQILMIETIASVLPDGWHVYVKEHPFQWLARGLKFFDLRYRGYYKKIAQIPNVKVVPIEIDSVALINNAKAVAVCAGTVGWDAVLRSKPALVFGYPWYQHCEGVFRIRDAFSCKEALEKIKNGFKISQEKVINFLASVDQVSFRAYFAQYQKSISDLNVNQNVRNISDAINQELLKQ